MINSTAILSLKVIYFENKYIFLESKLFFLNKIYEFAVRA
jgi:hypothetical protein